MDPNIILGRTVKCSITIWVYLRTVLAAFDTNRRLRTGNFRFRSRLINRRLPIERLRLNCSSRKQNWSTYEHFRCPKKSLASFNNFTLPWVPFKAESIKTLIDLFDPKKQQFQYFYDQKSTNFAPFFRSILTVCFFPPKKTRKQQK